MTKKFLKITIIACLFFVLCACSPESLKEYTVLLQNGETETVCAYSVALSNFSNGRVLFRWNDGSYIAGFNNVISCKAVVVNTCSSD